MKSSNLANRIREARRLSDMTRAQLARHIGVKPSAAAQWEYDNGTAPTVRNLILIATVTGVSFEWLATGRGAPKARTQDHVPAIRNEDFAHTLFEEQMLHLARDTPLRWRDPLLQFLRVILKKKG